MCYHSHVFIYNCVRFIFFSMKTIFIFSDKLAICIIPLQWMTAIRDEIRDFCNLCCVTNGSMTNGTWPLNKVVAVIDINPTGILYVTSSNLLYCFARSLLVYDEDSQSPITSNQQLLLIVSCKTRQVIWGPRSSRHQPRTEDCLLASDGTIDGIVLFGTYRNVIYLCKVAKMGYLGPQISPQILKTLPIKK